jgi:phosphoglycerate-specific signal transduction histidine kinase
LEKETNQTETVIETIWDEFLKESDKQLMTIHQTTQMGDGETSQEIKRNFQMAEENLTNLENEHYSNMRQYEERVATFADTIKFVHDDFMKNIQLEKKEQKDSENKILRLIDDIEESVHLSLKEEQIQGQQTHSDLLNLLETACGKIERSFMMS